MKKLILFLLISCAGVYAQNLTLKGEVINALDKKSLAGATIQLKHLPDSTEAGGTFTDSKGRFTLSNLKRNNKYMILISFLSYETWQKTIEAENKPIDLGKIELIPTSLQTSEIQIVGKVQPVVQKQDTSEFNAEAFKINKDATAEDLVSKMPGITVQDGKVQAHGEDVKRVLVDGRPFFGDDPTSTLRNLPSEIVDKIQVFDQQSEQSRFTGFDDGNASKAINIVTRMGARQGTFGRIMGGYGSDERWKSGGNINLFQNDRRISILGQINNTNEQNFSMEDLAGVMGGGGRGGGFGGMRGGGMRGPGGGGGGGMRFAMGGGGGFPGGDIGNFLVNAKNGLTTTKAVGLNYSDKWSEAFEVSGSYFFNLTSSDAASQVDRQYFAISNVTQGYQENSSSVSKNINNRFDMKIDYNIDSLNSMTFRPRITSQINNGSSLLFGNTMSNEQLLNSINTKANSDLTAYNLSGELLYRHRFAERGRTISLGINSSYKKNDGTSGQQSDNIYFTNLLTTDTLITQNQNSDLKKDGMGQSGNVVYTEPIGENSQLQLNAQISYSEDNSDQKTFSSTGISVPSSLDSSLSNVYKKIYRTQSYGTGYRYQKEGLNLMLGLNYNISVLENDATYPRTLKTEKTFYSFLPNMQLRYSVSRDQNLMFNYRAGNNSPSVEQLANVLNNSNPVQLSIGNPDLKQDNNHSFWLRYSQVSFGTMNSFFIMAGGSFSNNYIGNSTTLAARDTVVEGIKLQQGVQLSRPVNLDGYMNIRSFMTYSMPFQLIMSNVNFNGSVSYTKSPSMINGITNESKNSSLGAGIFITSNISRELDFSLGTNLSYNQVKNSVRTTSDQNYYNLNSRARFFWIFWDGFLIQADASHQYDSGLSGSYNRNDVVCNASIGKKIFSNDQGEIRLSVFDIFNKNNSIQRNVTDLYYEDTRSNVLGRYFLFTFTYNLRAF